MALPPLRAVFRRLVPLCTRGWSDWHILTINVPVVFMALYVSRLFWAQKRRDFQGPPLPMPLVMMLHPSKPLSTSALKTIGTSVVLCTRVLLCSVVVCKRGGEVSLQLCCVRRYSGGGGWDQNTTQVANRLDQAGATYIRLLHLSSMPMDDLGGTDAYLIWMNGDAASGGGVEEGCTAPPMDELGGTDAYLIWMNGDAASAGGVEEGCTAPPMDELGWAAVSAEAAGNVERSPLTHENLPRSFQPRCSFCTEGRDKIIYAPYTVKKGSRFSRPQPGCHLPRTFFTVLVKYGVRSLNFLLGSCIKALIGWEPVTTPPLFPPHLGACTRALLVSQDRWHLFVTPRSALNMFLNALRLFVSRRPGIWECTVSRKRIQLQIFKNKFNYYYLKICV